MKHTIYTGVSKGKFAHQDRIDEIAKSLEGKPCRVIIMDGAEDKRTVDQNKALWRWDSLLAEESGYTITGMHYEMCCAIFGVDIIKKPDGSKREVPKKTTSNLTKAEWQDYIRDYRVIARDIYNYEMPAFGYGEDDF